MPREQSSALERDLQLAEKVYRSLLPKRLTAPGLDVVTRVQPFNRIGGDYATVFPVTDEQVYLCVTDVMASGIASALLVARVNSFVREHVPLARHPCEVVEQLNHFLCEHFGELAMFVSFFCATVNPNRREFAYAGCGHPPALHFKAASPTAWKRLESLHMPLGLFPEFSEQCQISSQTWEPGDRILIYTDGLIEARNPKGELFGIDRLAEVASVCVDHNLDGNLLAGAVFSAINEFQGQVRHDDLLLMVVSLS